jgi:N-acetyl-anhydromuramyl-L-alanine amidase AmpD
MVLKPGLELTPDQYFAKETRKSQICLHFTAGGTAAGAIATWKNDPVQVATAFIVDRNGDTYQCFSPKFWAYHLGVMAGAGNLNHRFDRQAIGIEMVNWGGLTQDKDSYLYPWTKRRLGDFEAMGAVTQLYRGAGIWQAYPQPQLTAVRELVHHLCGAFAIPLQLPAPANRLTYDPKFAGDFRGVVAHQMYHREKTDPGPAFPWESLA